MQKNSIIYLFTGQYFRKKPKQTNKISSVALCDPWVFSSRLGLAVVCGIIFRSGHTITTFLLAFKNQKYMFLVKKNLKNAITRVKLTLTRVHIWKTFVLWQEGCALRFWVTLAMQFGSRKKGKKVITENSSATPRSFCGHEVRKVNNCQADLRSASASFA